MFVYTRIMKQCTHKQQQQQQQQQLNQNGRHKKWKINRRASNLRNAQTNAR